MIVSYQKSGYTVTEFLGFNVSNVRGMRDHDWLNVVL
jgi:hypothetical protein